MLAPDGQHAAFPPWLLRKTHLVGFPALPEIRHTPVACRSETRGIWSVLTVSSQILLQCVLAIHVLSYVRLHRQLHRPVWNPGASDDVIGPCSGSTSNGGAGNTAVNQHSTERVPLFVQATDIGESLQLRSNSSSRLWNNPSSFIPCFRRCPGSEYGSRQAIN